MHEEAYKQLVFSLDIREESICRGWKTEDSAECVASPGWVGSQPKCNVGAEQKSNELLIEFNV